MLSTLVMTTLFFVGLRAQTCKVTSQNRERTDSYGILTYFGTFASIDQCHWYFTHTSYNFAFKITFHYLRMHDQNPNCDNTEPYMALPDCEY